MLMRVNHIGTKAMTPSKVTYSFTVEDIKQMLIQSVDMSQGNARNMTVHFEIENVGDRGNTEYQLTGARIELAAQKRG